MYIIKVLSDGLAVIKYGYYDQILVGLNIQTGQILA
jgi:hypothetical protein